jgi:hypothetical protein
MSAPLSRMQIVTRRQQVIDDFVASVPEKDHERARAVARETTAYKVAELKDHLAAIFGPALRLVSRFGSR